MGDDVLEEFDEDFEDDETGEINPKFDDANKKKIRLAGIIVIILVGAYFAVDELVLKKEVVMTPPPLKKRPRPKKKPKKKTEAPKAETVVKKEPRPVENKPAPIPTPDTMADAQPPKVEENPFNKPPPNMDESPANDPMDSLGSNDDSGSGSGESGSSSGDLDFASDSSDSGSGSGSSSGMGSSSDSEGGEGAGSGEGISTGSGVSDVSSGGGAIGSSSTSIDRQETPIEYISPPNYEALGRGLVYNCIKQHWACVNKENFFQCRANAKWFESKNKASECMTDAVFATIDDCNAGQLQRINNNIIPRECYRPD